MRKILAVAAVAIKELIRKKDFYVLLIMMAVFLTFLSMQNFFNIEGITRYLRDFGYTLVILFSFIIAVTFTARQIPEEVERRTVYPLLAKPISRVAVVAGKFAGGLIVSSIAFTAYYAVFTGFYLWGGEDIVPVLLVQGYVFGIFFLVMVCAIVVFFSNFLTVSANVSISILLYFIMTGFSDQFRSSVMFTENPMSYFSGVVYYILPHLEFFDLRIRLAHAWDPVVWWAAGAVVLYSVFYSSLLIFLSGKLFERRQL